MKLNDRVVATGEVILGRYLIESFIDEGGMQQVYRARDLAFERSVALKTPKNESAAKRFERSAQVSARITHANVAKTLDYFIADGRPFLIEELIGGNDLGKSLASRFFYLDPHLLAAFGHRLSKGIAAAHHAGVFHRDLKPSNVMVSSDSNFSQVKITDFGIAKMAEQEIEDAVIGGPDSITTSQTAVGALPYMAPELIETPREAGIEADIWSVGAMLSHLASGDYPFGNGLPAVPRILSGPDPKMPTLYAKNSQFKVLGSPLWSIIGACLRREPSSRPRADELVARFEELCYSDAPRYDGEIESTRPGDGNWGFIRSDGGQKVFFHYDSFLGAKPAEGARVSFSQFPGTPSPRAHPVLPLRPDSPRTASLGRYTPRNTSAPA